jgi:exosortase A-associated hydrolase 1
MMNERAITFVCEGQSLVGILHLPSRCAEVGVVVVVGGPQYRVGSHRLFVQLARAVSAAGFAVLRFDVRGMGDSEGTPQGFENIDADIGTAIDALQANAPEVRRVVLWGLCDGASASLLYMDREHDARVVGVCAVNPWVRSEAGLARTQVKHYYSKRMLSTAFWSKLLRGGVRLAALSELWGKLAVLACSSRASGDLATDDFAERMARGCKALGPGGLLVILSENDFTAKEFIDYSSRSKRWQLALRVHTARHVDIAAADHTLSTADARIRAEGVTVDWLGALDSLAQRPSSAVVEVA